MHANFQVNQVIAIFIFVHVKTPPSGQLLRPFSCDHRMQSYISVPSLVKISHPSYELQPFLSTLNVLAHLATMNRNSNLFFCLFW